jgi:hypothetical protein
MRVGLDIANARIRGLSHSGEWHLMSCFDLFVTGVSENAEFWHEIADIRMRTIRNVLAVPDPTSRSPIIDMDVSGVLSGVSVVRVSIIREGYVRLDLPMRNLRRVVG